MSREGSCPCGAVRYTIAGRVRDVLVCHCEACREATGGPWPASAAARTDLVIADPTALAWTRRAVSAGGASRGRCRVCGTVVFWDAPANETVSFAVATLADAFGLEVAAHIWTRDCEETETPNYEEGLPASVVVPWRD